MYTPYMTAISQWDQQLVVLPEMIKVLLNLKTERTSLHTTSRLYPSDSATSPSIANISAHR
ncbi:hypothetical protein T11_12914 [Trichinella zimbabwensis]|uniref:Uncharacterized protein n=1 Tax=Trichinella zimbabwensis TaxID=268475 RepID=A0A0V1H4U4_9BILA|nr:hypothetical protein T11_12914 [Trichinella zimbabwensis]